MQGVGWSCHQYLAITENEIIGNRRKYPLELASRSCRSRELEFIGVLVRIIPLQKMKHCNNGKFYESYMNADRDIKEN